MASVIYNSTWFDTAKGSIDLDTDTFKVMLVNATYAAVGDETKKDSHAKRSAVTANEISGTGYTAGGAAVTAGAVNVLVLRPLWSGRVKIANDGDVHDLAKTAMPELFADSALVLCAAADSTATGIPELEFVIANG